MKELITLLMTVILGFVCVGQDDDIFESFNEEYINENVKNDTLLILTYRELSADEAIFNQDPVKHKTLLKFVHRENANLDEYNTKLEELFAQYYTFPYRIINESELKNYPSSEYPYLYKRYAQVKNEHFISYSRFFMNRKEKKLYKDLNLFASHKRERLLVERDIVEALNDFLLYGDESTQGIETER